MDEIELEEITTNNTGIVASLIPEAFVENDGGGPYIVINLDDKDDTYLLFSAPTLFNGENAEWTANDGNHEHYWQSESLTIYSEPETVVAWIQSVVSEAKKF